MLHGTDAPSKTLRSSASAQAFLLNHLHDRQSLQGLTPPFTLSQYQTAIIRAIVIMTKFKN